MRLDELGAAAERAKGRAGAAAIRALVRDESGLGITRSEAERRLVGLLRDAGLWPDATNAVVCGHEVDLVWRAERLIVEVDGFAFHGSRQAFERDRRRDADLAAAGWRVLRITWRRIVAEPIAVVAHIAQALAVGPPGAGVRDGRRRGELR